ncbi:MAG TPA: cupin domain-containing protein [Thermoanaerobaculia bacterium]|nr:cupin domain-containing protein [Thermoanaerobaculia bacterium]
MSDRLAPRVPRVVPKPWGEERIFAEGDRYAGKLLRIRAGEALSLQYHVVKDETIHVLEGTLGLLVERDGDRRELLLSPGTAFHVEPGTRHRMSAPAGDVLLVEVSTAELDDVVRLEDRYGREGTSVP